MIRIYLNLINIYINNKLLRISAVSAVQLLRLINNNI